jgi:hypothetical protein
LSLLNIKHLEVFYKIANKKAVFGDVEKIFNQVIVNESVANYSIEPFKQVFKNLLMTADEITKVPVEVAAKSKYIHMGDRENYLSGICKTITRFEYYK